MATGEVGNYKVVYYISDPTVVSSDMFGSYTEAMSFVKNNKLGMYLVFEKQSAGGGHYQWKILKDGSFWFYRTIMLIKENWFMIAVVVAIAIIFYVLHFAKKQGIDALGAEAGMGAAGAGAEEFGAAAVAA